jgi:uncharacterized membrane protein
MNFYLIVRFLHIISAIIFFGGIIARQLVRSVAEKTNDVRNFAALSTAAGRIENIMVIPGNMAVVTFGIILALITDTPLFGFLQGASKNWLLVTNLLLVIAMAFVPTVFLPRGKKFDLVLRDALAQGQMTAQLREALADKTVRIVHFVEITLVVIVVILMVFKPF